MEKSEQPKNDRQKIDLLKSLKSNGFEIERGLGFCGNSEEIYSEVLKSTCDEGKEKIPLLQQCLTEQDLKRYQIETHGIKNVAMTIGATQLLELASSQEQLAKEENLEGVSAGQNSFIQTYERTIEIIEQALAM